MRKLILLFLISITSYGQAEFPEGVQITGGQPTVTTDPYVTTTSSTGVQGKVSPENIPLTIIPPTTHYTPLTPNIKGHFQGIDTALGNIVATTAGVTTRVWFTGDVTTVSTVNYYATNATGKGSVPSVTQTVVNGDNEKKYFTQDLIGAPFATATLFPPGVYAGNLSASTTPNSAQQRYTVELYKCNNSGTPIASGITGAPVGSLGVTVITILDSGLLTLADGSVTNVPVSGNLASQLSVAVGERVRYHVSAEKVGTAASNITQSVWYGNNYNSYIDVPVPLNTNSVQNLSTVTGATTTDALNTLNTNKLSGSGVSGQVSFWDGSNSQTGDSYFTWDDTGKVLTAPTFNGYLNGAINRYSNSTISDLNIVSSENGVLRFDPYGASVANNPNPINSANGVVSMFVNFGGTYGKQLAFGDSEELYLRRVSNGTYLSWSKFWTDANLDPVTKAQLAAVIPSDYSKIVYFNAVNPASATIFALTNPPLVNDNSLKTDVANLYIGTDASTWVYDTGTASYVTKTVPASSNFYIAGTTTDAGSNKAIAIERTGTVGGADGTASNHFVTKGQLDAVATSGSYTPTFTGVLNVASYVLIKSTYIKDGNIVTVNCGVNVAATSASTNTEFTLTLPFPKATSASKNVGTGTISATGSANYYSCLLQTDSATTVKIKYYPSSNFLGAGSFIFQYDVTD